MSNLPVRYHCRHVHPSGHRCGSPALRGEPFCYHHHATRGAGVPRDAFARSLVIPALEDRATLQQTLSRVLDQVANGMLDLPSARVLLYGLQIAQSNLPPHKLAPPATETVEEITLDEHHQPLAPEQEFLAAPHERTLEEILVQQWEEDKANDAAERAERAERLEFDRKRMEEMLGETVPTLQATATPEFESQSYPVSSSLVCHSRRESAFQIRTGASEPHSQSAPIRPIQVEFARHGTGSRRSKAPRACGRSGLCVDYAGDHLISHTLTRAVPSAQRGLTSVFGMGTGVTLAVNSPANCRTSGEVGLTVVHN